ncbi:hypothetical protein KL909_002475 [Ogataea angusta]|nr:hypothetical protein KL909_002475 [Ogataea angusta]
MSSSAENVSRSSCSAAAPVHVHDGEQHLAETAHGDAQKAVLAVLQVQRQAVLDHEPQHVVAQRVLDVAEPEHVIGAVLP